MNKKIILTLLFACVAIFGYKKYRFAGLEKHNLIEEIKMKKINIPTKNGELSGDLFLPIEGEGPFPAVVVTGAWTTVKEQMPSVYAKRLAENGYAALIFDFRGWGDSKSLLNEKDRYMENPIAKIEDIKEVFNAISLFPELDGNRVAGLGICASAGYMSAATGGNDKVKSVALVAPWLHDKAIVEQVYGGEEGVRGLIDIAKSATNSDTGVIIEAASMTNEKSLMYQAPYYTEEDRGLIEEYDNKFNVASWDKWLTFDAIKTADEMDKPLLAFHSEEAAIPQGLKKYSNRIGGEMDVLWIDGATQFDFYDKDKYVSEAVDAVVKHLDNTL